MAITFLEKRKKLKFLVPVFVILIFATVFVLLRNFFTKEQFPITPGPQPLLIKKIEINLETLEHPLLKELQPFEKIPPFEDEAGRENPFISY